MARSFLLFFDDNSQDSVCCVSSIPVEHWLKSSKNNYLIRRITNQNILGFLLQLQVQMKTSLEVMNMNTTYEVRSEHSVDFQRNAMPL